MPPVLKPIVSVMTSHQKLPPPAQRGQGVDGVTACDVHGQKARIKSTSLLGAGCRDGIVREAWAGNVRMIKTGRLIGPPRDQLVPEGMRFGLQLEGICRANGVSIGLRRISRTKVLVAGELLLSSVTKKI